MSWFFFKLWNVDYGESIGVEFITIWEVFKFFSNAIWFFNEFSQISFVPQNWIAEYYSLDRINLIANFS